jgi:hypothetical protein
MADDPKDIYVPASQLPASWNSFKLELSVTAETADAAMEIARLTHAVPAEEATKQAQEETRRTQSESRRVYMLVGCMTACILAVIAVAVWKPDADVKSLAVLVAVFGTVFGGVVGAPTIIEKWRSKNTD